jgi:release factor glutamine methyltransferase
VTSLRAALEAAAGRLEAAGCETPRVDAELLLAQVLGTNRSGLQLEARRSLSDPELDAFERMTVRREAREPVAYILGEWGFRRLSLKADARALIPRPETEIVVDRCLALLAGRSSPHVLDVGTGGGAIALGVKDELPDAHVTGLDSSSDALALARENAARVRLRVELVQWDLREGLPDGPWDLVVSNPPYVLPDELGTLEPEVRDWEPRVALVGDGAAEAIARAALEVLSASGALVLETAADDANRVAELLGGLRYADVRVTRDLTGRDRVVEGVLA